MAADLSNVTFVSKVWFSKKLKLVHAINKSTGVVNISVWSSQKNMIFERNEEISRRDK